MERKAQYWAFSACVKPRDRLPVQLITTPVIAVRNGSHGGHGEHGVTE
jgi:hypothetical protein